MHAERQGAASSSRIPFGSANGCSPALRRSADSWAIRGSWLIAGTGRAASPGARSDRCRARRAPGRAARPGVPGLEVGVADRPGRGDAVDVLDRVEVALPEPEQDRAVDLGVAADVVVLLGGEGLAGGSVGPLPGVGVALVQPDGLGVPVLHLARHEAAALQQQHPLPGGGERVGQGAAAGSRADDDDVVVVGHDCSPGDWSLIRRWRAGRPTRRWRRAAWRGR